MKRMSAAVRVAALVAALSCAGCASWSGRSVRFDAAPSGLDFVQMLYLPGATGRNPVALDLGGNGYVEWQTGLSPRVIDSFSTDIDSPHWNDLRVGSRQLSAEEMRNVFQRLIDLGLFDENRSHPKVDLSQESLSVVVRHGFKRAGLKTNNPDFLHVFRFLYGLEESVAPRSEQGVTGGAASIGRAAP